MLVALGGAQAQADERPPSGSWLAEADQSAKQSSALLAKARGQPTSRGSGINFIGLGLIITGLAGGAVTLAMIVSGIRQAKRDGPEAADAGYVSKSGTKIIFVEDQS
ncbi:MAG: hypothetical protein PF961_00580 [Planctomycetota bacterium]|nr:hypothetical protein [Planctomycetota bacterium]